MSTPSEKSRHANGSANLSHEKHEGLGQERHPVERENVISLALSPNGQERARVGERDPVENKHDPLQSPYPEKKETAQLVVEQDFDLSRDGAQPRSKGVREDSLEQRTAQEPLFSSYDATRDQQELERLVANVRSIQREEAAVRLPRAAQLPSVPGLAPASDGIWPPPPLEPEYLMRSRDNLRGPRTMIKIFLLIVSIFTVPMAYYFWMGGWDPIPRAPSEMASFDISRTPTEGAPFDTKSIMPSPKLSSEQETTIARGGDFGTPAKGESRTAKSFAAGPASMLQPDTPGVQDLASGTSAYALDLPKPATQPETIISRNDDPRMPAIGELRTSRSPAGESRTARSSVGETVAIRQSAPGGQEWPSGTARALDLKPLSQQETAISPSDDPRTLAKREPRTAKSSAGETVAPRAQDPPSSPVRRGLDPEQMKLLMKQGEQFIAAGDLVTARIAFQRAAEAGDANAAVALGATYDPTVLAKLGVVGISADVAKARTWYQMADQLGSPEARQRLEVLANR